MSHQVAHAAAHERPHPSNTVYVAIAVFLAVVTSIEVAVYYIQSLRPLLVPILLSLSAIKFATVAGFYMHLRFDARLFTYFFGGGLLLAASLVIAVMLLMQLNPGYVSPPAPAGAAQSAHAEGQSGG